MMSAKSIEQRLLRLEFLVSTLMADRDQLMEYVNAERVKSATTHDAGDSTRRQTQVEWGTEQEGSSGLRKG